MKTTTETRCDDCGTTLGEILPRSGGPPVCLDCFQGPTPSPDPGPSLQEEIEQQLRNEASRQADRANQAQEDAAYWHGMYRIMVRIVAEQHDDPALAWLDEIVHTRFGAMR